MNRPNAGEAGVGWFNEYPSAHVLLMGLKFDALAPIYLVHGIHDDGGAFEGGPTKLATVPGAPSLGRFPNRSLMPGQGSTWLGIWLDL